MFAQINCNMDNTMNTLHMQCVCPHYRHATLPLPLGISQAGRARNSRNINCRLSLFTFMLFWCVYPDQVPAWWCLDQDLFTPWVEWPMPIWTAGKTEHLCCIYNNSYIDTGQMSALCLSAGQWLLLEAPQIGTRRQQVPFRSFLRYCTFSFWILSHC